MPSRRQWLAGRPSPTPASMGELEAGQEAAVKIEACDSSFYHNQILKSKHGVDTEAIKAYFPLDHVVATTLAIYQELLSLTFTEIPKGEFSVMA
jgi:Zn-dependent oligopeptidase